MNSTEFPTHGQKKVSESQSVVLASDHAQLTVLVGNAPGLTQIPEPGQEPMARSLPVAIASDQSAFAVTNAALGAPTDAKSAAVDATSTSEVSLLKQLSYSMQGLARATAADAAAVTRPANTTVYAANDAVSNSATAASVTPISWTISDTNDEPVIVRRVLITSTDTGPGTASAMFRLWLYRNDPTASSGVVGGDNAAFSTKLGTYLGTFAGQFKAFSDGSAAVLTPEDQADLIVRPASGAKTLYGLLQTMTVFTPSANSTTFVCTLEGFQGRA